MTAIIVIAGLVALVWGVFLLRHGDLIGGCLMVLLTGSCLGHPFFHVSAGPLPLTIDRALLGILAVAYVFYRRNGWADPKPLRVADTVLVGLIAYLLIRTFTGDWRVEDAQPAARLAFFYLMPAATYWIVRQSRLDRPRMLWTFGALAVFGIYLAITAIAERQQCWALVFPKYIASAEFTEFYGRARGPCLNPVGNGLFLYVGLCCTLLWWPRLKRNGQLLLLGLVVLFGAGLLCTLTRSVWLGVLLGVAVLMCLCLPRVWRYTLVSLLVICCAIGLAARWNDFKAFKRDRHVSVHDMSSSANLRPILAAVAWQMFLDRPLFGCGFGQYKQFDVDYLSTRTIDLPLAKARPYHQHNVFLALLTETGLIGAVLFLTLLALWTRDAWRLWNHQAAPLYARQQGLLFLALVPAFVVNGMFHDLSVIPTVNMLLFFLAGVTNNLAPQADTAVAQRPTATPGRELVAWLTRRQART